MGIDLGTSSVKAVIMSAGGAVMATGSRKYPVDVPENGFAEQSPELWWEACSEAVGECIGLSGLRPEMIKCVGFSGQMHGTVAIDREKQPLRPAIIHCDQRSTVQAQLIKQRLGDEYVRNILLNPVFPGFQLVTLCWMREKEPRLYEQIYKVLLPKDYIRFKLTGEIATDYTDASGTLAFDIRKREWCSETMERLGIDAAIFPECLETSAPSGRVTKAAAGHTGLAEGTLVVAGGADQVMQALGNGVTGPKFSTITIGTSGQVFIPTQRPVANDGLNTHTFCGAFPGSWYTLGAILNAGICLNWFKNKVCIKTDEAYNDIDREIADLKPGGGALIFLPYLTGERTPLMDSYAKGVLFGITLNSDYRHIARAIMEGVVFALKECMDTCSGLGLAPGTLIASGGGARSRVWVQMLADIFNREIYTTNTSEHACIGAAIAAGKGCGLYSSIEEGCRTVVKLMDHPAVPSDENVKIYGDCFSLYKEIYKANAPLFKRRNL